jgi:hypothetical protein
MIPVTFGIMGMANINAAGKQSWSTLASWVIVLFKI